MSHETHDLKSKESKLYFHWHCMIIYGASVMLCYILSIEIFHGNESLIEFAKSIQPTINIVNGMFFNFYYTKNEIAKFADYKISDLFGDAYGLSVLMTLFFSIIGSFITIPNIYRFLSSEYKSGINLEKYTGKNSILIILTFSIIIFGFSVILQIDNLKYSSFSAKEGVFEPLVQRMSRLIAVTSIMFQLLIYGLVKVYVNTKIIFNMSD